jgi:hypothetical protein
MEVHLHCYCNKIPCSNLDQIYKDTNALIEEIDYLCFNGEVQFFKSWVKIRRILSMHLSIKDHKPVRTNGRHPTQLIVSAHSFTQCLSKLAYKSIKQTFQHAGINFQKHTLKNSLALKRKLAQEDFRQDKVTIVKPQHQGYVSTVPIQSSKGHCPILCLTMPTTPSARKD